MLVRLLPTLLCVAIWFARTMPPARAADEKPDSFMLPSGLREMKDAEAAKLGRKAATEDFAAGRYRVLATGSERRQQKRK